MKTLRFLVFAALMISLSIGAAPTSIVRAGDGTVDAAAAGGLDTSFSSDGMQNTDFGGSNSDVAFAVALQSDGKIVAVGHHHTGTSGYDFAVARYKTGGGLDAAFSGDGKLTTGFGSGRNDTAQAVAIQSDGKILVAGSTCDAGTLSGFCKIALARYTTGGALDTNFSGDGKQTATIGGYDTENWGGLAIQSNGKIVVAATTGNGCQDAVTAGTCQFAVLRFNANGSFDTTFSGDGKVSFGFGSSRDDFATDLVLQSDGKIVVEGATADSAGTNCYMAVARLSSAGALDTTFSGDGKQTVNFGGTYCFLNGGSVAIDGSGRVLLGGYKADPISDTLVGAKIAVARLTSAGALDTAFNGTGKRVINLAGDFEAVSDLKVVGGKILAAGRSNGSGNQDFALLRFNSNGSLDTSFSADGIATFDFTGGDDMARGLAIDGNGKYVLAGQVTINAQNDFGVMRVLP